ncbi:hypothetical protein Tco_0545334 [Tanacetum coccineum]
MLGVEHRTADFDMDPAKLQDSGKGQVMGPQEAFNRITYVVHKLIKKMEMVEEKKVCITMKTRSALEACDQELKDKLREVAAFKMKRKEKAASR